MVNYSKTSNSMLLWRDSGPFLPPRYIGERHLRRNDQIFKYILIIGPLICSVPIIIWVLNVLGIIKVPVEYKMDYYKWTLVLMAGIAFLGLGILFLTTTTPWPAEGDVNANSRSPNTVQPNCATTSPNHLNYHHHSVLKTVYEDEALEITSEDTLKRVTISS
ncbi:hypothetical protein HDE_03603 [Halotydeus destructor]|nr:hypothetical protein HDE_03603 [Halotydeus destructor]